MYKWIVDMLDREGNAVQYIVGHSECAERLLDELCESAFMAPPAELNRVSHRIVSDELTVYRAWYSPGEGIWPDLLIAVRAHHALVVAQPCWKPSGLVARRPDSFYIPQAREACDVVFTDMGDWENADIICLGPVPGLSVYPPAVGSDEVDIDFGRADGPHGGWEG